MNLVHGFGFKDHDFFDMVGYLWGRGWMEFDVAKSDSFVPVVHRVRTFLKLCMAHPSIRAQRVDTLSSKVFSTLTPEIVAAWNLEDFHGFLTWVDPWVQPALLTKASFTTAREAFLKEMFP